MDDFDEFTTSLVSEHEMETLETLTDISDIPLETAPKAEFRSVEMTARSWRSLEDFENEWRIRMEKPTIAREARKTSEYSTISAKTTVLRRRI